MCGVFGIINDKQLVDEALLRKLTDAVMHRGPDGGGVFAFENVGLGHRRLSVIDLSDSSAQPMRHAHKAMWITYNGEIYNYLELRAELQDLGHIFITTGDTEVLLAAYVQWGRNCLSRFNGMWAFAIFDQENSTVFLARDRFGVKPLYLIQEKDFFAFGSEIRQLLPLAKNRKANRQMVEDFLVCGLSDHTDATFFEGITKLRQGTCISVDTHSLKVKSNTYYKLRPNQAAASLSPDDAAMAFGDIFKEAINLRLRSDVPVGTCLSGGLDSSSIAAFASATYIKTAGAKFRAITAVSEEKSNSEEEYARLVVEAHDLDWIRICPDTSHFSSSIEELMETQEEPFGGPSIFMQYFVMKAARENGVTVLLDGQGGDETLLGYDRYYSSWLRDRQKSGLANFLRAILNARNSNTNLTWSRLVGYYFGARYASLREALYRWRYPFLRSCKLPAALKDFAVNVQDARDMQTLEIEKTNLPMLLRYEDKNSMRFGVETRLPFLDYRLVEFALGLSVNTKMNQGWTKWPLRSAFSKILPTAIVWRKNKQGFEAPDKTWLSNILPEMLKAVTESIFLTAYCDKKNINQYFLKTDRLMQWRMYCLAVWANKWRVES
jgi:asparagine synthase (glutamine-hydrolysing)